MFGTSGFTIAVELLRHILLMLVSMLKLDLLPQSSFFFVFLLLFEFSASRHISGLHLADEDNCFLNVLMQN